ncbi:CD225/dispanin family protein [Akkermansiaceae bacterium]|nr:CD225/dispanin family protein [Akkermansiaceae bacterium]
MEWFYTQNGIQHGPVTEAELSAMIANGTVTSSDLAWHKEMNDWKPIHSLSILPPQSQNPPTVPIQASPYQTPVSQTPVSQTPVSQTPVAQPTAVPQHAVNVPNYLWQSIVVTLFCCLPFGVVAIVKASKVDSQVKAGDYNGAVASSNSAKTWCWVSFGVGLVVNLLYIIASLAVEA